MIFQTPIRTSLVPPKRNLSVASGSGLPKASSSKGNNQRMWTFAVVVVVAAIAVVMFGGQMRFGSSRLNNGPPVFNANISRDVFMEELRTLKKQLFPSQDSKTW